MIRIEVRRSIERPIDQVFDRLVDVARYREWMLPGGLYRDSRWSDPRPSVGPGAEFEEHAVFGKLHGRVSEFEPPRRVAFHPDIVLAEMVHLRVASGLHPRSDPVGDLHHPRRRGRLRRCPQDLGPTVPANRPSRACSDGRCPRGVAPERWSLPGIRLSRPIERPRGRVNAPGLVPGTVGGGQAMALASAADVLSLQRMAGNRAVSAAIERPGSIQRQVSERYIPIEVVPPERAGAGRMGAEIAAALEVDRQDGRSRRLVDVLPAVAAVLDERLTYRQHSEIVDPSSPSHPSHHCGIVAYVTNQ